MNDHVENPDIKPGFLKLLKNGQLQKRAETAAKHLTECYLCPHECGINREVSKGFCRAPDKAVVSSSGPHSGEEPPLVGERGSGTIFFAYCNMRCVFCQNCELSFGGEGETVSNSDLAEIMLELQNFYGCHNINFVTPTHFVPNILKALVIAGQEGLSIPLVYNCAGYEKIETLQLLDGVIDIYMPDFKYDIASRGQNYSGVNDYPTAVQKALKEMDRQVGGIKTDQEGIAYRGLIIRHLIMPDGIADTKKILEFIEEELSPDCLVNLMEQYYPAHEAYKYKELSRRVTRGEYKEALQYANKLGLNLIQ